MEEEGVHSRIYTFIWERKNRVPHKNWERAHSRSLVAFSVRSSANLNNISEDVAAPVRLLAQGCIYIHYRLTKLTFSLVRRRPAHAMFFLSLFLHIHTYPHDSFMPACVHSRFRSETCGDERVQQRRVRTVREFFTLRELSHISPCIVHVDVELFLLSHMYLYTVIYAVRIRWRGGQKRPEKAAVESRSFNFRSSPPNLPLAFFYS